MQRKRRKIVVKKKSRAYLDRLFSRADKEFDRGKYVSAFRLFLKAAKEGDISSELNVGYLYDTGIGVRRNRVAALSWYKKAYRHGCASGAHNIGIIYRDKGNIKRALIWFQRAVDLGDDSSNLDIAKYYLNEIFEPKKAMEYLRKVANSDCVSEEDEEEAQLLIKRAIRRS
jgi:uncharacterized protein